MKKFILSLSVTLFGLLFMAGCLTEGTTGEGNDGFEVKSETKKELLIEEEDYYVLGGDILLDKSDENHIMLIQGIQGKKDLSMKRGVKDGGVRLWPNGRIEYHIDSGNGSFSNQELDNISLAMLNIARVCNVEYVSKNSNADYRYKIIKSNDPNIGGSSTLGYTRKAKFRFNSSNVYTIMHELMHGLGLSHEHQRPDRDNFVTIKWNNIEAGREHNFAMLPPDLNLGWLYINYSDTYGTYDYDSIMHYGSKAFSINGNDTIKSNGNAIGQRDHLSATDIDTLQTLYGANIIILQEKVFEGIRIIR